VPETFEIYALIEAQRKKLGLSQAEVSKRAFNRTDTSAIQNLKRGSSPSVEKVEALCEALGLEFYIGPKRGEPEVGQAGLDYEHFAEVPRFDADLAAGSGRVNHETGPVEHLAFSRRWLQRLNVDPENACLLSVKGDSMEPTLLCGDMVLVDQDRKGIRDCRVYAFMDIDGLSRVKRLEKISDEILVLRSDNPTSETEFRRGEEMNRLEVLGEVVWSGHTWT